MFDVINEDITNWFKTVVKVRILSFVIIEQESRTDTVSTEMCGKVSITLLDSYDNTFTMK